MKHLHSLFMALMVFLAGASAPAQANLETVISDTFGSMVNVTSPAAYAGARRGVLTGGSIVIHNKRMNPTLISFKAPEIKAGCGGISIFGGAFTAINLDEMVEYMRAIMSNALTYLFQLGITAICPSCSAVMNNLEAIAAKIGNSLKDSCEAGKALAGMVSPALDTFKNNEFEKAAASAAEWTDSLIRESADGLDPFQRAFGSNPTAASQAFEENVVLTAIERSKVLDGYLGPSASANARLLMAEQIMSIIGTVTITKEEGADKLKTTPWPGNKLAVRHLLWGKINAGDDNARVYQCQEYDSGRVPAARCLNMTEGTRDIIGLGERIGYLIIGPQSGTPRSTSDLGLTSDTTGIYDKIVRDVQLSAQERSLLAVTPVPVFPVLREYGLNGGPGGAGAGAALSTGRIMSEMIAADVLSVVLSEVLNEVQRALALEGIAKTNADLKELAKQIAVVSKQIDDELKTREHGRIRSLADLSVHYQSIRDSLHGSSDPSLLSGTSSPGG